MINQDDKIILEGEILEGAEEKADANEKKVIEGFWKTLAMAAGKIPFMEELIASYYCALDPQTPNKVRATLLAALAYFVLPIDIIPDFLIAFGFSDDVAILGAVLASLRGNIRQSHRDLAREKMEQFEEMAKQYADQDTTDRTG